jgi:hypothetical protein
MRYRGPSSMVIEISMPERSGVSITRGVATATSR